MQLVSASGRVFNLDFEPIYSLNQDSRNYVQVIIDQINSGYYSSYNFSGKVLDVGANIGLFSIYASTVADIVYAVEPTTSHYRALIQILNTLGITNVMPVNAALWTENGSRNFYIINNNTTQNSLAYGGGDSVEVVRTVDLETLLGGELQLEKIDFMKCDIEGGEIELFQNSNFQSCLGRRVDKLLIEGHQIYANRNLQMETDTLESIIRNIFVNTERKSIDCVYGSKTYE